MYSHAGRGICFVCLCYQYYHRHKYTNIYIFLLRIRAFQNSWTPTLALKNIIISDCVKQFSTMYVCIYIYGEKKFRPDWKVAWTWYEIYIFFLMPDLESTGSETHESAIKKKCLCICAYGSSGSIDIQSIYLVLHVNTYEYIYVYIYICVHTYCMYVCIDVYILARMYAYIYAFI